MREVLEAYKDQIENSDILKRLGLEKNKYLVISAHREENVDIEKNFKALFSSLNKVVETIGLRTIFSVHPRTRKRLEASGFKLSPLIEMSKPFGYFEYIKLQKNAYCVLSDSGSVSEESNILDFPAALIRTSTERQEAEISKSINHSGYDFRSILSMTKESRKKHPGFNIIDDYISADYSKIVCGVVIDKLCSSSGC